LRAATFSDAVRRAALGTAQALWHYGHILRRKERLRNGNRTAAGTTDRRTDEKGAATENMKVLISLDKPTDDITNEAIKYSIDTSANSKKKDDYISELQKILELEKKIQDEHKLQNILLKEKYDKLSKDFQTMSKDYQNISKEYQLFQKECEELNKARSNQINDLEKTISEVRQKYTK